MPPIAVDAVSVNAVSVQALPEGRPVIVLSGRWGVDAPQPDLAELLAGLDAAPGSPVAVEGRGLESWDSALPAVLLDLSARLRERRLDPRLAGFPDGVMRLLGLAAATPEQAARRHPRRRPFPDALGEAVQRLGRRGLRQIDLLGALALALGALLGGRERFRPRDFWLEVEACGARALPIVGVIALLVGMIMAFVGAIQLRQFGAQIYVANLVAVAVTREMGALMTAVVLAGRSGAAFAAQIGAMQGNEEIDALTTLGIPPVDFLVLPRVGAMVLMMPLLCLYADAVGLAGGALVGVMQPGVTLAGYLAQSGQALKLADLCIGLAKSAVFGLIVASCGCNAGMAAERNAEGVGRAATAAVVSAILSIIVADALFAIALSILGL